MARTDTGRDTEFAEWFLARRGRLLRTAYLLVGDPDLAEDLVQETAANLYLAWDRLDASGAVDPYAPTTLINQARKLCRRPWCCLLYTSPNPRDPTRYRMPSSA